MVQQELLNLVSPLGELWGISSAAAFQIFVFLFMILLVIMIQARFQNKQFSMVAFICMFFMFTLIGFLDWIVFVISMVLFGVVFFAMNKNGGGENG